MVIARLLAEQDAIEENIDAMFVALEHDGNARKLASGAWEFDFPKSDAITLRASIEQHFAASDVLITDHPPVLPALFISDMDSTMISAECIDELADFAGIKPLIAAITERAMLGELDFVSALHERVALLKGLPEASIARCLQERIAPMPGARTLVQTLRAKGCRTVLVTGGFHQFADPVAARLGFEHVVANRLAIADGKLTGRLGGPICDSTTKRDTLRAEMAKFAGGATSLAMGDGANDIPMLEAAHYGIAFCAKPKARAAADGWINHDDLTAVLRLFDIPEAEWVGGDEQSLVYPGRVDGVAMFSNWLQDEREPFVRLRTDG